jgi:hypothetical protein
VISNTYCIELRFLPPEPYDADTVNEKHKNHPGNVTLAELAKEANKPRITAPMSEESVTGA